MSVDHVETRVRGLWRGRELDSVAHLRREADVLSLDTERGVRFRVPARSLDGLELGATAAMLYLASGDVLELSLERDEARALLRGLRDAACTAPEFMRSLRWFGRPDAPASHAQTRWFAPLLEARRRLAGVSDPIAQAALFDPDAVLAGLAEALAALAAERAPESAPRRRAIEAELEDATDGVRVALAGVALAGSALAGSAGDTRLAEWRRWIGTIQALFRAADDAWPLVARALGAA